MSNIDIILRALGADAVADAFHGITSGAQEMGDSVENAAGQAGEGLDEAGQRAADLDAKFKSLRNAGGIITGIGAASLLLSANLRGVAEEGNAMEARLESILKQQKRFGELDAQNDVIQEVTVKGHFDDDDGLRNAAVLLDSFSVKTEHMKVLLEDAARQARTMGTEVGGVAEQLGKAYNTGNVAALKKSGVTLDTAEIEKLNAAYARSAAEGQAMFVQVVGAAITNNTVALEDSLTDAQAAANDVARGMDDLKTTIGTGAAEAHAAIDKGLLLPLLNVLNAHPGLLKTAGGILEIGGSAMTVIGPLIGFAGQVGMMRIGLAGMGTAGVNAFRSMMTSALTAAPAIWGAMAPVLGIMLSIVAVALLAAAALYALDKIVHAKEDKELRENIAKGDATDGARLENVNKERQKKGKSALSMDQFKAWENDTSGEWKDPEDSQSNDSSDDLEGIKKQLADLQSGGVKAPSMPIPTPGALPLTSVPITTGGSQDEADSETAFQQTKPTKVAAKRPAASVPVGNDIAQNVALFLAGGGTLFDAGKNANAGSKKLDAQAGRGEPAQIEVRLRNEVEQDGNGDTIIHFQADPVRIPNRGLGKLRGKVR